MSSPRELVPSRAREPDSHELTLPLVAVVHREHKASLTGEDPVVTLEHDRLQYIERYIALVDASEADHLPSRN